jgi:hypothetical protein
MSELHVAASFPCSGCCKMWCMYINVFTRRREYSTHYLLTREPNDPLNTTSTSSSSLTSSSSSLLTTEEPRDSQSKDSYNNSLIEAHIHDCLFFFTKEITTLNYSFSKQEFQTCGGLLYEPVFGTLFATVAPLALVSYEEVERYLRYIGPRGFDP